MKKLLFFTLALLPLFGDVNYNDKELIQARDKENEALTNLCQKYIPFYTLAPGEEYREITEQLLKSPVTSDRIKSLIQTQQRRFFLFSYPSDGYQIKGYISYTPEYKKAPLLLFLRGGNQMFGLNNPANNYSCIKNYTVIATTYRGGVSEGKDEYCGNDVNDVKNLVDFLPQLETNLALSFTQNKKFLLGGSRGGTQMLLAIERHPDLQDYFDKAVSLSGPTDLYLTLESREDMKMGLYKYFGLTLDQTEKIDYRSPILHCSAIQKDFPLLLIYGTDDARTHIDHGRKMFAELQKQGNDVTYWEYENGDHCLNNVGNIIDTITDWLEEEPR